MPTSKPKRQRAGDRTDLTKLRRNAVRVSPTREAIALFATLPDEALPERMLAEFPHVLNRIADLWKQPLKLDAYFHELLVGDHASGRQGFPLGVALEITHLKEHYQSVVYPLKRCIWAGGQGT